jgi:hypothetical protein
MSNIPHYILTHVLRFFVQLARDQSTAGRRLPRGNTAEGTNALLSPTTGTYNTALGLDSLLSDSAGKPVGISQLGLVAEDVEKVNPDLVVRDKEGEAYSVRYDQVNAMLLNEFLKEHGKLEQQEVTITHLTQDFQSKLAEQQKKIEILTAV